MTPRTPAITTLAGASAAYPPDPRFAATANAGAEFVRAAEADPLGFWAREAARLHWTEPWRTLHEWRPTDAATHAALRAHVAAAIGPIARPRDVVFVAELPKTRSGKIMRRLLVDLAEGRPLGDTTSLQDPAVPSRIADVLAAPAD